METRLILFDNPYGRANLFLQTKSLVHKEGRDVSAEGLAHTFKPFGIR